jgi:hypothetical protein
MTNMKHNFWVWSPYSTMPGVAFVTKLSGLSNEQSQKLYRGEFITPVPHILIEDYIKGRFYDQLGAYIGVILVSPVLRKVLDVTVGTKLQFIPVDIRGKSDLEYFAVNVLDTVPALDMELSKFDTFSESGGIRRIEKLVLRPIPANSAPIFHAAEDISLILVSDELRGRLVAASKHPGVLTPVEQYRNEF